MLFQGNWCVELYSEIMERFVWPVVINQGYQVFNFAFHLWNLSYIALYPSSEFGASLLQLLILRATLLYLHGTWFSCCLLSNNYFLCCVCVRVVGCIGMLYTIAISIAVLWYKRIINMIGSVSVLLLYQCVSECQSCKFYWNLIFLRLIKLYVL